MKKSAAFLIVPLALLAAACGSSATNTNSTPASSTTVASKSSVSLSTKTLPGVGAVLVNGQGHTLYTFAPDNATKVTCTGSCASYWPPLKIASGQTPAVSGGVSASMVSSDADPSGGNVVTYHGWPLYTYVADSAAGTDHGQAINLSGGRWYVISAAGTVVKSKSSGSSSSSSPSPY